MSKAAKTDAPKKSAHSLAKAFADAFKTFNESESDDAAEALAKAAKELAR